MTRVVVRFVMPDAALAEGRLLLGLDARLESKRRNACHKLHTYILPILLKITKKFNLLPRLRLPCSLSVISTAVRNLTWPVWPYANPCGMMGNGKDEVPDVIFGRASVNTTPALVPTHKRSLHTSRAVIRRHAALCCRMIASEPIK